MRVAMAPDELLSTWLARAALTLGCDPLVLTGCVWPQWRAWIRDLDRGLSDDRMAALAEASGVGSERLAQGAMTDLAAAMTGAKLDGLAVWPWMIPLGARNRRRYAGLQFCPDCLASDAAPHFRRSWRLSCVVWCEAHQRPLLDRCPHCQAPPEPHRLLAEDEVLSVCATCRGSLADAPRARIEGAASGSGLTFQRMALSRLAKASDPLEGARVGEWFDVVRSKLVAHVASVRLPTASTRLRFELLPVQERAAVLESFTSDTMHAIAERYDLAIWRKRPTAAAPRRRKGAVATPPAQVGVQWARLQRRLWLDVGPP